MATSGAVKSLLLFHYKDFKFTDKEKIEHVMNTAKKHIELCSNIADKVAQQPSDKD